jgi:hypothetical protein
VRHRTDRCAVRADGRLRRRRFVEPDAFAFTWSESAATTTSATTTPSTSAATRDTASLDDIVE